MAQEPALYECIYQYDIHGTDPSGAPFTETGHTALQIGATQAKFQDYTAFGLDSLDACEGVSEELRQEYSLRLLKNACFFDQTVYQNVPQGQMTVQSVITPDYYVYRETPAPSAGRCTRKATPFAATRAAKRRGHTADAPGRPGMPRTSPCPSAPGS